MSVQIFRLKDVPEDEAEDVRQLLQNNHIEYFETPAGNWGISMPAIWLQNDDQQDQAKLLIEEYQQQRSAQYKNNSAQRKSVLASILENPLQLILYTAFAAVILYFSIKPFLNFGQ